jgi:hypothetical protein
LDDEGVVAKALADLRRIGDRVLVRVAPIFANRASPTETDWLAGVVRLELEYPCANDVFEKS